MLNCKHSKRRQPGITRVVVIALFVLYTNQWLQLKCNTASSATNNSWQNHKVDSNASADTNNSLVGVSTNNSLVGANHIVHESDHIYSVVWDSPIVIESHKLVFFYVPKVGCTVWKQLFHRMQGHKQWKTSPHGRKQQSGLTYLSDFPIERANKMITSQEWTRAMFVRDPRERFLSAYLDKVVRNKDYGNLRFTTQKQCCPSENQSDQCLDRARESLANFMDVVEKGCLDVHWQQQSQLMEQKYYPQLNFVGHLETAAADAETLLRKIGAWEEFGETGWGPNGDGPIFGTSSQKEVEHATSANKQMTKFFTPELEERVRIFYRSDYVSPHLNLTYRTLF